MANAHRANVLVTSCLKTPVDPHTKAPLALYERQRALPCSPAAGRIDNRDYEKEVRYRQMSLHVLMSVDSHKPMFFSNFYFSNEEYYRKLEELKRAHLRTMAELEGMYRKKLELKSTPPSENVQGALAHRCVVALVWN
uniref:Uncharacterized protein n=1 Tax=Oncorhynchus mykiss TaxID=8022 RepID=A0A8C7W8Z7_ONCMY